MTRLKLFQTYARARDAWNEIDDALAVLGDHECGGAIGDFLVQAGGKHREVLALIGKIQARLNTLPTDKRGIHHAARR